MSSGEASLAAAAELFSHVPYLKHSSIEPAFLSRAALQLTPLVLVPRENVSSDCLTIVFSGLVAKDGVCGIRVFGDDMILNASWLLQNGRAMALTLVQLQRMTRESLDELLAGGQYPQAAYWVRRTVIRLTMQRVILATARWARENSIDAGAEPNLQECFQMMGERMGWLRLPASPGGETTVTKSGLEVRIDQIDANVATLSTRLDSLGGTMQRALEELLAMRAERKRAVVRRVSRKVLIEAADAHSCGDGVANGGGGVNGDAHGHAHGGASDEINGGAGGSPGLEDHSPCLKSRPPAERQRSAERRHIRVRRSVQPSHQASPAMLVVQGEQVGGAGGNDHPQPPAEDAFSA